MCAIYCYFVVLTIFIDAVPAHIPNFFTPDYGFDDPDFGKLTPELISSKGYPVETHTVETTDHYVLTIHRIPNGNGYNNNKTVKPIAFLMHGLLSSSADFVINFKENSLGFILYDRGYDVWIGNSRGNFYGHKNTEIPACDPKFWEFSSDEMALIDLPNMMDYVLNKTEQSKLFLLGYSMGGSIVLGMMSELPEYQDKIIATALMAPLASVYYVTNPMYMITPIQDFFFTFTALTGTYGEVLPLSENLNSAIKTFCKFPLNGILCLEAMKLITGSNKHINKTRVGVYFSHYPAGTSVDSAKHFFQEKRVPYPIYRKFDFGAVGNMAKYNQINPPEFNLNAITKTPCGLFSSIGDKFIVQKDIDYIRENVPTIKTDYILQDEDFSHFDFSNSASATTVYEKIIEFWGNYTA